jgi:hypothetical protein
MINFHSDQEAAALYRRASAVGGETEEEYPKVYTKIRVE